MTTAYYVPGVEEPDTQKIIRSLQLIGGASATATDNIATNTTNIATNTTNIASNTADLTALKAAWTTYAPTPTASSGAFTSASAAGRYLQIGKTVFLNVAVTITTNGTAAGAVLVTLPVTAKNSNFTFSGRENALTGFGLTAFLNSTVQVGIQKYDGTYLGSNGSVLAITGTYEAA